jgi:hypothetical protein
LRLAGGLYVPTLLDCFVLLAAFTLLYSLLLSRLHVPAVFDADI